MRRYNTSVEGIANSEKRAGRPDYSALGKFTNAWSDRILIKLGSMQFPRCIPHKVAVSLLNKLCETQEGGGRDKRK